MKIDKDKHCMTIFPEHSSSAIAPSASVPQYAVVTQNLMRTFGQKVAVNNLNLMVQPGEFFGFLGPNGAGKSTTIKMMVGMLRPSSGNVWVAGVDVWKE